MTRRALFRAEAGPGVGGGHAMRCLALAEALAARGWHAALLTGADAWPVPRWRNAGFDVLPLAATPGSSEDARVTAGYLAGMHADLLVLDGYLFPPGHAAASRSPAGEIVLRFDDLGTDTGTADIVLNGNAGAQIRFAHDHASARRRLLGADYFLVRREVAAASAAPEAGRIALTLGAAAEPSLLIEIARGIAEGSADVSVDCVGPFETTPGAMPEMPHRIRCMGPDGLVEALSRAALVVCGAGVTALEAASLGVPTMLVTVADNQVPGARAIDAAGAGRYMGNLETVRGKIPLAVAALVRDAAQLATMSANARALVDGRGAARVADVIEDELRQRGLRPGD